MGLLDDLDRRRESELRDRENSARLAQSYATFSTTGLGTVQYEGRVGFGLTFIERPMVSHAAYIDVESYADSAYPDADLSDEDVELELPVCTGYVTEWDEDERGFYIGAWIAVKVFLPVEDWPSTSAPLPEVEHHFTFAAIAMKDLPVNKDDATVGADE